MSFVLFDSTGRELRQLSGTAAGDLTGSYPNPTIAASDWTQVPDAPVDQAAWAAYRQALRDLPENTDPFNPVWPESP